MTYRQLTAHYTDGTAEFVCSMRTDEPKCRDLMEKAAFEEMARDEVERCTSKTVSRTYQTKGSAR